MSEMIGSPGTAGWIQLTVFLVLLIPMNLLAGGAVIAAAAAMGRGERATRLSAWLVDSFPGAAAWTIAAGIPTLWIRDRAPTSNGPRPGWPILEIAILMALATVAHLVRSRRPESRFASAAQVVFALALVAIVFVCASGMGAGDTRVSDPTLLPRSLHLVLAAIAVAGMLVALHGLRCRRFDAAYGDWVMRHGMRWFVIPTAIQIIVGFSFLLSLPDPVRSRFMGGSAAATAEMLIGVLLAIALFAVITHASNATDPRLPLLAGAALLAPTLLAMGLLREQIRNGQLRDGPVPGGSASLLTPSRGPAETALLLTTLAIIGAGVGYWIARRLAAAPDRT